MQIKTYQQKAITFVQRLSDIRFAGQVLFVIIVLLISWSGVKAIQSNYDLQKQIAALKQQNSVQKLENTNLSLQNEYYNSNQYLELSARQNFGLASQGETELIVPASVAMAYTVPLPSTPKSAPASSHEPSLQRHVQSWVDFFLHRPAAGN